MIHTDDNHQSYFSILLSNIYYYLKGSCFPKIQEQIFRNLNIIDAASVINHSTEYSTIQFFNVTTKVPPSILILAATKLTREGSQV
jgi:hypothetical protein